MCGHAFVSAALPLFECGTWFVRPRSDDSSNSSLSPPPKPPARAGTVCYVRAGEGAAARAGTEGEPRGDPQVTAAAANTTGTRVCQDGGRQRGPAQSSGCLGLSDIQCWSEQGSPQAPKPLYVGCMYLCTCAGGEESWLRIQFPQSPFHLPRREILMANSPFILRSPRDGCPPRQRIRSGSFYPEATDIFPAQTLTREEAVGPQAPLVLSLAPSLTA